MTGKAQVHGLQVAKTQLIGYRVTIAGMPCPMAEVLTNADLELNFDGRV